MVIWSRTAREWPQAQAFSSQFHSLHCTPQLPTCLYSQLQEVWFDFRKLCLWHSQVLNIDKALYAWPLSPVKLGGKGSWEFQLTTCSLEAAIWKRMRRYLVITMTRLCYQHLVVTARESSHFPMHSQYCTMKNCPAQINNQKLSSWETLQFR